MAQLFTALPKPFIVGVINEKTPETAIAAMRNAGYDGADAYNIHISRLEARYLNNNDLSRTIRSTARPVCVLNYRNEQDPKTGPHTEDELADQLLMAVEAGAVAVDMPADTFDPVPVPSSSESDLSGRAFTHLDPKGITFSKAAVEKQMELIGKVHAMGAEVLISVHTNVSMDTGQAVSFAEEIQKRNPDMIKIVNTCNSYDQLAEAFKTVIELKKRLTAPFLYICQGEYGKLTRSVGPMLGSMLIYCVHEYKSGTLIHQPLIRAMRTVLDNVDWQVPE